MSNCDDLRELLEKRTEELAQAKTEEASQLRECRLLADSIGFKTDEAYKPYGYMLEAVRILRSRNEGLAGELETARAALRAADDAFCDGMQLINAWKMDTPAGQWSEWDEHTRLKMMAAHTRAVRAKELYGDRERCHAGMDGECIHRDCPQIRDEEPEASGRHCPLDTWVDEDV